MRPDSARENILEELAAAKGIECNCWSGVDKGLKEKLQRVENKVWRQILAAQVYTPLAALQDEVGASTVEGTNVKITQAFANHMTKTAIDLLELFSEN